jgi:hypothetical protein
MAISDNQKIDFLFKKLGLGAAKTDTVFNKLGANESIASPLLMRGDTIWSSSGDIPNVRPTVTTGVVEIRTAVESVEDITATGNRTWKTGITDWIPTEFGATYIVNVYIHTAGDAAGAETMSNKVFTTGSGNNDEWFFDYQSGILNFIGDNLPNGKSFTGNSVFISGATYAGPKGVASASGQQADVSSLQAQIDNIVSNTDPATLDSLTEIVAAFQGADSTFATSSQLIAQNDAIRTDLEFSVSEINSVESSNLSVVVTGLKFDVGSGFELTDNSDGTVTISSTVVGGLLDLGITDGAVGQVLLTDGSGNFTFGDADVEFLDLGISDGTNGQVLVTDGNGNFSFADNGINLSPIPAAQAFIGNGVTVSYPLTDQPEDVESVDVYVNDVLQRPSVFAINANILTFSVIPDNGAEIYIKYRYPFATMTSPVHNSIENHHLNLTYTSNQYTGDNSTTQYTVQTGHSVHSVLVIVDGAILPPTSYSISNTALTLNVAPAASSVVDIRYLPV